MKELVKMKKIKILMILNNLNKCDGISSYVMNYYKYLDKNKFHIDFVVTTDIVDDEYKKYIKNNGSKIFYIKSPHIKSIFRDLKNIKLFIKENSKNYDIIHSHVINDGYFYFKFGKKYNINKRILHSHNTTLGSEKLLKKIRNNILARNMVKLSTTRFACSNDAGKYLFKNKSFYIIHNAIDTKKFKFDSSIRKKYRKEMKLENNLILGHVGRLDYQKNHEFLIDVLNEVVKVRKDVKLLLIGSGPLKEYIMEKVNKLKLNEFVEFLGTRSDVHNLMQAMDLFLFPSLFEGLGIVTIEAQAVDLPCIVSNNVPKDVKILNTLKFNELDINEWCNYIVDFESKKERESKENKIIDAGYDIDIEIHKLESKYIQINNLMM